MALQNLTSLGMSWPNINHFSGLYAADGTTLDAAGAAGDEKAAFVYAVPITGTLTDVAFGIGLITNQDPAFSVRLETLDVNGKPSGTLIDDPTNVAYGSLNIAASDDNIVKMCQINGGTGVSVTKSQRVAMVLCRSITGTSVGIRYRASNYMEFPYVLDYGVSSVGVWTKLTNIPFCAVKIDGVWYCPNGCFAVCNNGSNTITSTASQGMKVNVPFKGRISGVRGAFGSIPIGTTLSFKLYSDPEGTPVERATTVTIDTDELVAANYYTFSFQFTTPYVIAANTSYALVMCPDGASGISLVYFTSDATISAAYPGGSNNVWYSRANSSSAFTADTGKVPMLMAEFDQLDDGAGGGGATPIVAIPMELSWR